MKPPRSEFFRLVSARRPRLMDIKLRPPYRSRSKTLGSAVEEFGESKFLGGARKKAQII